MQKFAFIIHPINARRDVGRKYRIAKYLPESVIEWYIKQRNPLAVAEINGICSIMGEEAQGWLSACPLTPRQRKSSRLWECALNPCCAHPSPACRRRAISNVISFLSAF